jgi:hypothetical protein
VTEQELVEAYTAACASIEELEATIVKILGDALRMNENLRFMREALEVAKGELALGDCDDDCVEDSQCPRCIAFDTVSIALESTK